MVGVAQIILPNLHVEQSRINAAVCSPARHSYLTHILCSCWDPFEPVQTRAVAALVADLVVYVPADHEDMLALLRAAKGEWVWGRQQAACCADSAPAAGVIAAAPRVALV